MQINTKFDIGDSVVFLHRNAFYRGTISRIEVSASSQGDNVFSLVQYYFANLTEDFHNNCPAYKYESEVAATKEELAKLVPEMDLND